MSLLFQVSANSFKATTDSPKMTIDADGESAIQFRRHSAVRESIVVAADSKSGCAQSS
jgi:hypothetical protein